MKWISVNVIILLLGSLLIIGCGGGDSNFYSLGGEEEYSGSNEFTAGEANSIEFISATPQTIALKGTGGPPRSETSRLIFMVVDENGNPVPGQTVNFELSTEIGGLSLSNLSDVSDSGGLVQVTVNAGNVSTHVRVQASLDLDNDTSIKVLSDMLAVFAGLPDQNSISLAREICNPEAWNYDNVEVPITFQAADLFNNFVPDGTVVYFTTGGGSIIGSSEIIDGVCEVIWRSGEPRPDNGRFTILAFCIGEESFTDMNGNGLFDKEDSFDPESDLSEPFRDANENGIYDYGEWFWDYNNNGEFDEANGIYNGILCSDSAEALGLCTKELVYVQRSASMIMSGSFADIDIDPDFIDLTGNNFETVHITIADVNGNPMPYDTVIKITTSNGKFIDGTKSKEYTVGNACWPGAMEFWLTLIPSEDEETLGILEVEVTTPYENVTTSSIGVSDEIFVAKPSSIEFISATPQTIALKGTGDPTRSETSKLIFMVVDENGNPVPDQTVNFELSTEIGGLSLSNPNDVSDSGGLVQVTVNAGNVSTHVRVSAILDSNLSITGVSDEIIVTDEFIAGKASSIQFISATPQTIAFNSSNGSAVIVFKVVDESGNPVTNETVNFGLSMETGGLSLSNPSGVSDSEGLVSVTLNADNESTPVSVIATLDSDPSIKGVSDEIFVAKLGSIEFISTTPQTIAPKGTGGPPRSETSKLVFMVVDIYGNPVPDQTVNFELSTEIGGLSLSNPNDVSDSGGLVHVTVNAGNVSTHVRVQASLDMDNDTSISVLSDMLAVFAGLPDQNSISLAAEIYNPEAWNYNNVEVPIIFQAADLFNNFVPDGTVVYFTTEGGSIIGSSEIIDGVCEVIWRSGEPRPDNGLFTLLAFCIGEESFTDVNGNGLFDEGDWFDANNPDTDLSEPFRDDNYEPCQDSNQKEIYDYGEWFWDYNNNGEYDEANGKYNGSLCSDSAEASGLCTKELVYVRRSIHMIMSGSFADIDIDPDFIDLTGNNFEIVHISIADVNNNPMPYDTVIKIATSNGEFVDGTKSKEYKVGSTCCPGPMEFWVTLIPSEDKKTSGILQVEVKTPHENLTTSLPILVLDDI